MLACEVYDEYADTPPNKHENVARLHPKNSDTAPNCVIALPPALSPSMELMEEDLHVTFDEHTSFLTNMCHFPTKKMIHTSTSAF